MKALSWLKYFVYLLLLVLVIWLKGATEAAFQTDYNTTYQINYLLYSVINILPIIVGVVIGLEAFINERTKTGRWKLNLPKLILVAIPSLYASILYFLALIQNETIYNIFITPVVKFFGGNANFIIIFQVVLGYSLITLCQKVERKNAVVVEEDKAFDEVYDKENIDDTEFVSAEGTETDVNTDTVEVNDSITEDTDK